MIHLRNNIRRSGYRNDIGLNCDLSYGEALSRVAGVLTGYHKLLLLFLPDFKVNILLVGGYSHHGSISVGHYLYRYPGVIFQVVKISGGCKIRG